MSELWMRENPERCIVMRGNTLYIGTHEGKGILVTGENLRAKEVNNPKYGIEYYKEGLKQT
jgi:hypothetical protein